MREATQLLTYVNLAVFGALTLACVSQWRRHDHASNRWATAAFGSLSVLGTIGLVLQHPQSTTFITWLVKALLVILLLFPYLLYRFTAAFVPATRRIHLIASGATVAIVVWSLALPRLPMPGLPEPLWWSLFRCGVLVQWTILFAIVGIRLWSAGRVEASVARRRMRTLALAAAGMDGAILLSGIIKAPQSEMTVLVAQTMFVASSMLFFVGLAPPAWLVALWRRPEERAMRAAMNELVRAESQHELASLLLPRVVGMIGARGATLITTSGELLGRHGTVGGADDLEPGSAADIGTGSSRVHRVELRAGTLLLWTSPYAPFFGREEFALIEGLGALADIVLDRCALDERRREAEQALAHQALHDSLTGLPNRVLLMDRLSQAQEQLERRGGALSVLFLDLDHFKVVNDTLDHLVGDALLKEVAKRLTEVARSGDTVARFGGDEFVVVAEVTGEHDALELGQRLLEAVSGIGGIGTVEHQQLPVTASVGVVVTVAGRDPELLVRDADVAMYRAKQAGRDRVELFDERARLASVHRAHMERELRAAVTDGTLDLHYQPVVNLSDGLVAGVEALLRWDHPTLGMVLPAEFIPLAEESALIVDLGTFALATACRQARTWRDEIPGLDDLTMWVNVSGAQLNRMDLCSLVSDTLAATGLPAHALGLEITESVFVQQAEPLRAALTTLRDLGVRIAIDDFGTGFSSLGRLKDLPTDVIKIDGCFVNDLGNDVEDVAIVAACMALADALGLTVVAECIETTNQLAVLLSEHCHHGQGYLFSAPLRAEAAGRYLRRHRPPLGSTRRHPLALRPESRRAITQRAGAGDAGPSLVELALTRH
jgi:diguanylate cyclase (GGDEF)-like protein